MSNEPFLPFTPAHGHTILAGSAIIAILLWLGKRSHSGRNVTAALLAFSNLISYPLNQVSWMSLDGPVALDNLLPFHLCDIAAVIAGFALITRHPLLCALTYFWGLAATLQALITPALELGFPSLPYFSFFVQHFAIVATALFLPIVDGWRPKYPLWKSPLEIYVWSVLYLLFALAINTRLGTNFGFASHPPHTPSLIDHLGPWPWYLFSIQAFALVLFFLLALPFRPEKNRPSH